MQPVADGMERLTPPELEAQAVDLFSSSGKNISYIRPAVLGRATLAGSGGRCHGIAVIVLFLIVGGALLLRVREPEMR